VRVRVAGVDLQLLHQGAAQVGAGQHAPDSILDQPGGVAGHGFQGGVLAEPAGELRVVDVLLVLPLLAGQPDLVRVDHHHEVAAIGVRGEDRLVLAAQDAGDGARNPPQHLVLHVDDHPAPLDGLLAAHHGLHFEKAPRTKIPLRQAAEGRR